MAEEVSVGCMGMLIMLAIVMAIGGFCCDYVVYTCWGKDLPTWADCCIGLVTSGIVIPAAIVCFIVEKCDVETPFFNPPTPVPAVVPVTQPAV